MSDFRLIKGVYDWGDRALQECNLSTQLVRRLQVKQAPIPRCGVGFLLFADSANTVQSEKLMVPFDEVAVHSGFAGFCGLSGEVVAGLDVTGQSAEQGPNETAEFSGDSDLGLVALESAAQQVDEAKVQTVLCFPTQIAYGLGLAFLTAGEFFADFGRQSVMLGAFG